MLDREFGLYDFGNDGSLDFLSSSYDAKYVGKNYEFSNTYEIFTMNESGVFRRLADKSGKPYFIKRVYKEDDYYSEIENKFEHYWIEEIR